MSGPLILDSLQRRMRAMHSLYYQAVSSMSLEHVNHFERDGVLPIAFSLFHATNIEDASFMLITGAPPIWDERWQARVAMAVNDHGKHLTVAEMVHQRIGDYAAFCEYQRAVFDRTEAHLDGLDPADLGRIVVAAAVPAGDREHLQRPGGRAGRYHRAGRLRVLAVSARATAHGGDRAGPGPGRARRDDVLNRPLDRARVAAGPGRSVPDRVPG